MSTNGASSTSSNPENQSNDAQAPTQFNMESDVNDMIGDLVKEELQLAVTRFLMAQSDHTDNIKKEVIKIFKSRSRVSQPSQSDLNTMNKLAQNFRQVQQQFMISFNGGAAPNPLLGSPGLDTSGFPGASQLPFFDDAGNVPLSMNTAGAASTVNLSLVRRKIKDSFLAQNKSSHRSPFGTNGALVHYRLDTLTIRTEKEKGKAMIVGTSQSQSDLERVDATRTGLSVLEAVTSEFTNRGNELGESNIVGYADMLHEIATDWVDIFLLQDMPISQNEREEFAKKLFDWDTSASEEQGTFSTARAAARKAWDDVHLQNVLKGEHIGKFVEPIPVTIARINQLERDSRFEEAVNLARAVDLYFYAAKFLVKLNRTQEAEEAALKIEEKDKVFSIAQVARALDIDVAFNLIMRVLSLYAKDMTNTNQVWNADIREKASYAVDLAISSKNVDTLISKLIAQVRHKNIQYNIALLLTEKEQYAASLQLCKDVLKPYPTTGYSAAVTGLNDNPNITTLELMLLQNFTIVDVAAIVPKEVTSYIWNLSHEMVVLNVHGDGSADEFLNGVIDYILEHVKNVGTLVGLVNGVASKSEYKIALRLIERCFATVDHQEGLYNEIQKELVNLSAQHYCDPNTQGTWPSHSIYANAVLLTEKQKELVQQSKQQQQKQIQQPLSILPQQALLAAAQQPSPTSPSAAATKDEDPMEQDEQKQQPKLTPQEHIEQLPQFAEIAKCGSLHDNDLSPKIVVSIDQHRPNPFQQWKDALHRSALTSCLYSRNATPIPLSSGIREVKPIEEQTTQQTLENFVSKSKLTEIMQAQSSIFGHEYNYQLFIYERLHDEIDKVSAVEEKVKRLNEQYAVLTEELSQIVVTKNVKKISAQHQLIAEKYKELKYATIENNYQNVKQRTLDQYHSSAAHQAIICALNGNDPIVEPNEEKRVSADKVDQTVNLHLKYLHINTNIFNDVANKREYELALRIAQHEHDVVDEMIKSKTNAIHLQIALDNLMEEQQELATKKQQKLSIDKQKEVKRLQKNLSDVVTRSDDPCANTLSVASYISTHYEIARRALQMAISSLNPIPINMHHSMFASAAALQKPVKPLSRDRITQVLEQQLRYIKDPDHFITLSSSNYLTDFAVMYRVVEQGLDQIRQLMDQTKAQDLKDYELRELQSEEERLTLIKKSLPSEKQATLSKYLLQIQYDEKLKYKHERCTQDQLENKAHKITSQLLVYLLKKKHQLTTELDTILNQELLNIQEDQMEQDEEEESASSIKKKELTTGIQDLENQIQPVIDLTLGFVHNPKHLLSLCTSLQEHADNALSTKQAISLAEHTQREIENLDSLLQDRKHIKSQLQDLQQEQRDIEELRKQSKNKGKRLDDDKQSLLNELTKKVYVMDREASYLNFTSAQLDDVHYNVAIVMIQSAISKAQTDESRSEMKIASCVNDQDKVIEKQEANKNKSLNDQLLETVIDRCMGYVKHPEYVMKLLNMIAPNIGGELESENGEQQDDNDLKQVLKLGRRVVDECGICEQRAHAREIPEQTLLVLEKEQSDLEVLRKDLTAAQKTQIEELKQKMENDESMKLPSYLTVVNYDEISNWKFNALYKMMNTLLSLKRKSDKAIPDAETREESTAPFEALRQKYHEMLSNDVLNLVKIHLTNLTNLNQIITQLQNHKEYDLCVSLANHAHEAINKLRNEIADRVIPEQKYVLLEAESNKLLTQRKQLTVEQQDELRQLKINHALYELQPKYKTRQTDSSLDKLAYQYSHAMVVSALSERNETDLRVTNDSQMDSDVAQQESDSSVEKLESIVDQAVDHLSQSTCFGIENTIKILLHLNTQLQYPLVLRVGKVCQARIDRLRDLVITIFALEKEKQSLLSNKREDNMDNVKTHDRIRAIDFELSRLPVKYKRRSLLDHLDLNVAHHMINASKIEEDEACQREQAIKIFKINMTPETFGEVKVLTVEEEWEKLRRELLQYVLDRIVLEHEEEEAALAAGDDHYDQSDDFLDADADDFGGNDSESDDSDSDDHGYKKRKRPASRRGAASKKKKTTKEQTAGTKSSLMRRGSFKERIELLLNEGMYRETIAVFPKPPKGTLELLERLYIDIRKGDQKQLEGILPLVDEYVTKDYMQFNFTSSVELLDLVEEHFRPFVIKLYESICEKMIVNLVPKQYGDFVDFLKAVKARLIKYGSDGSDATDDEEEDEESEDDGKKKRKTPKKRAPKKKAPKRSPWEEFIENVKSTHKGKKKLMSMVTMQDL